MRSKRSNFSEFHSGSAGSVIHPHLAAVCFHSWWVSHYTTRVFRANPTSQHFIFPRRKKKVLHFYGNFFASIFISDVEIPCGKNLKFSLYAGFLQFSCSLFSHLRKIKKLAYSSFNRKMPKWIPLRCFSTLSRRRRLRRSRTTLCVFEVEAEERVVFVWRRHRV